MYLLLLQVAWNPSLGTHRLLAVAGQSGLLRVLNMKCMNLSVVKADSLAADILTQTPRTSSCQSQTELLDSVSIDSSTFSTGSSETADNCCMTGVR